MRFQGFLYKLGYCDNKKNIIIYANNKKLIKFIENPIFYQNTKHINI